MTVEGRVSFPVLYFRVCVRVYVVTQDEYWVTVHTLHLEYKSKDLPFIVLSVARGTKRASNRW